MQLILLALLAAVAEGFGHYVELVPAGGAWYVYNDTQFNTTLAPPECDADFAPGVQVPDSCCEALDPYFGLVLADFFAAANCPATDALLPDFKVVRPYLSCDDGAITYGEECVVDGQEYGRHRPPVAHLRRRRRRRVRLPHHHRRPRLLQGDGPERGHLRVLRRGALRRRPPVLRQARPLRRRVGSEWAPLTLPPSSSFFVVLSQNNNKTTETTDPPPPPPSHRPTT